MTIRQATIETIPQLTKLAQETYLATFGDTMTDDEKIEALKTRDEAYFRTAIQSDTILVAIGNKQLMGFIQFGAVTYDSIDSTDQDIELNKIYIDIRHQGKGIGKALMEAMMNHPKLDKIKNIYLDVYDNNEKAIALYEKYGFKTIGKTPFELNGKIVGYDLLMKFSK